MWRFLLLLSSLVFAGCAQSLHQSNSSNVQGFKASLVHYQLDGELAFAELIKKVEEQIQLSKRAHSQLVVFPEYVVLDMLRPATFEEEAEQLQQIAGRFDAYVNELRRMARIYDLTIIGGSSPRLVGGRLKNVSPVVFPDGKVFFQEKVFLTPWEKKHKMQSGTEIGVIQFPWGSLVNLICYDVESPLISDQLSDWKPSIFIVPSMTESRAGLERVKRSAQARAIEHHSFILVASAVGEPQKNWKLKGESALYVPQDVDLKVKERSEAAGDTQILHIELPISELHASRLRTGYWPVREAKEKRNMLRIRSAPTEMWKGPTPRLH